MPKRESPNSTRRVRAAAREKIAIDLRKGGATYAQIAEAIAKSEGSDKPVTTMAICKMITRAFARLKEHNDMSADELRTLELERLDSLLGGLWDRSLRGDEKAVQQTLAILDRRYKLLGIEPPKKVDVNVRMTYAELMAQADTRLLERGEIVDGELEEIEDDD